MIHNYILYDDYDVSIYLGIIINIKLHYGFMWIKKLDTLYKMVLLILNGEGSNI